MAPRTTTTIDVSGPFFTKNIEATLAANARTMMAALAAEGERDVVAQLRSGQSTRDPIAALADHVADHAKGRVRGVQTGTAWKLHAVISVNNIGFSKEEGTSLMAAAATVEREIHAFRRTTSRLKRARAAQIAELTKGLN